MSSICSSIAFFVRFSSRPQMTEGESEREATTTKVLIGTFLEFEWLVRKFEFASFLSLSSSTAQQQRRKHPFAEAP